eukprot:gene3640-6456_t
MIKWLKVNNHGKKYNFGKWNFDTNEVIIEEAFSRSIFIGHSKALTCFLNVIKHAEKITIEDQKYIVLLKENTLELSFFENDTLNIVSDQFLFGSGQIIRKIYSKKNNKDFLLLMGENNLSLLEYDTNINRFLVINQISLNTETDSIRSNFGWKLSVLDEKNLILVTNFNKSGSIFYFNEDLLTIEKQHALTIPHSIWDIEMKNGEKDTFSMVFLITNQQEDENEVRILQGDLTFKNFSLTSYFYSKPSDVFEKSILIDKITSIPFMNDGLIAFKGSKILFLKMINKELKLIDECSIIEQFELLVTGYSWELFNKKNEQLLISVENGKQFIVDIEEEKLKIIPLKELNSSNPYNIIMKLNESDDCHFVFCSSRNGDGKIYSLDFDDYTTELVSTTQNIAPIIDIELMNENENEFLVSVGGCPSKTEKKLKLIQKGLIVNSVLKSEPNYKSVNGLWTLSQSSKEHGSFNKFIVMSFISETRIMGSLDSQIEDVSFNSCFETNSATIEAGHIKENVYVQITEEKVIIIECENEKEYNGKILCCWKSKEKITLSSISGNIIVLCDNKDNLLMLNFISKNDGYVLVEENMKSIEQQISCVHFSNEFENYIILGTYSDSILFLDSKNFNLISKINLNDYLKEDSSIPQSILFSKFPKRNVLFIGLRDGNLLSFDCSLTSGSVQLMNFMKKKIGDHPIALTLTENLYQNGKQVLATSNNSWLVSNDEKLNKFNINRLNIEEVGLVKPISIEEYENGILNVLDSVQIYTINSLSVMSIKEYETDKMCNRILSKKDSPISFLLKGNSVLMVDLIENEIKEILKAEEDETFFSQCLFEHEDNQYLLLGSQQKEKKSNEFDTGNIRILKINENKSKFQKKSTFQFEEIECFNLPGVVFCIEIYQSKYIVCSAGKTIMVLTFSDEFDIFCVSSTKNFIRSISCGENRICISDEYDSVILFQLEEKEKKLKFIQGDIISRLGSSCILVNDDFVVGTDREGNIFSLNLENNELVPSSFYNIGETCLKLKRFSSPNRKIGSMNFLESQLNFNSESKSSYLTNFSS